MDTEPAGLGYVFTPFSDGFSLGYAELRVYLGEPQNGAGFVPAAFHLCTWDNGGVLDGGVGMSHTTIAAHTPGAATHVVAPGFVTVSGYGDAGELAAYCFGGSLTFHAAGGVVACRLTSGAPILNLSEEGLDWSENAVLRVADDLESELAALRAQMDAAAEETLDRQLAQTDARLLYAVALELAYHSFQALPEVLRTEHYWDEYSILARARTEAGQTPWWPSDPSLRGVLGQALTS